MRATALVLFVLSATVAFAQGRVTSTATETRRVTQTVEREIQAVVSRGTDTWVAYRVATIPTARQFCGGSHVVLEPVSEMIVMARVEARALTRLRVFTPECDVDTGRVALLLLEGVQPNDSAAWLTQLVKTKGKDNDREWQTRVADPAFTALATNAGDTAVQTLIGFAKDETNTAFRSRALLALGQRAGAQATSAITTAIDQDPEIAVKRTAVQALARLPKDEGIPLLIQVARTNRNAEVRREAMLRLGQTNDVRAARFFEEILLK